MQSSSTADQASLASTCQTQATCSEDFALFPTDSMADLWRQLDRTTLRSSRRTPLSSAHLPRFQAAYPLGSPNTISDAGNAITLLRHELQNTNRHQSTPNSFIGISAVLDDIIYGKKPHCQLDSPDQQINTCNESSDQNSMLSTPAFSTSSVTTPLSRLAKQQGKDRSRNLGDHHLDDVIVTLPNGTDKGHTGRQNTVFKRIRLRRAWKRNLLKSKKRFNG